MKRLPGMVLAFAAGVGASWVTHALLRARASPSDSVALPAVRPRIDVPAEQALRVDEPRGDMLLGFRSLEERLDGVEAALRRLEAATAASDPNAARQPLVEPATLAQLGAAVERLEAAIELLRANAKASVAAPDPNALVAAHPEPDWEALWELMDLWRVDEKAALQRVQLLDQEALLRTFGSPTELWGNEKGVHWMYGEGFDPVDEIYRQEVYMRLNEGVVTVLGVKER